MISPKISPIFCRFQRVRPGGFLFEAVHVGKELLIDKVAQIVAPFLSLGCGPATPAGTQALVDVLVFAPFESGLGLSVLFKVFEVFKAVVEFCSAASLLAEDIVDIPKGLFKHGSR